MKKITIFLILLIVIYFIYPKVITNPRKFNLSSNELQMYIKRLDNNDSVAYLKLFLYYHVLHEDENSTWIIICKGKNMSDKSMTNYWNNRKILNDELCKNLSINDLKDYGSIYYPWKW